MQSIFDWFGLAANALSVLLVLGAVMLWALGRNPLVTRVLNSERHRTVGRALTELGVSRPAARAAVRQISTAYVTGQASVELASELDWLDALALESGGARPVTLFGLGQAEPAESLDALSSAYLALSRRMRARGLLGGGSSPLVESASGVAAHIAAYLASCAAFRMGPPPATGELQISTHSGLRLEFDFLRLTDAPGAGIDEVRTSHIPVRLVIPGTLGERLAKSDGVTTKNLALTQTQVGSLADRFRLKVFDGVVPSLDRAEYLRDPGSGRTRLHLVVEEAAFSTVLATHYVGDKGVGRTRRELHGQARLLTLAVLPITSDGYLVMARRSAHVSVTAGKLSPAVTGNLEMRDRTGMVVDRDADGLPSPLMALARECAEELGLAVTPDQFDVHGTLRFSSPDEVGTTVLLTTAQLSLNLEQVASASANADRVEGAWESEKELLGVPVPESREARERLLAWAFSGANHVPHLVGSIVAMSYPALCADLGTEEAATEYLKTLASDSRPRELPPGSRTVGG